MGPSVPAPARTQPVALRVADLAASREFFEDLFGLQPAPDFPATGRSVVLTSPIPGHRHFSIKLTTDAVPVRLAGVHVELETTNELLDLYFLALLGGYRTSELRFRRGSLSTTITDPDGHTVEVEAHNDATRFTVTLDRRPWRAEHRPAGRHAGSFDGAEIDSDAFGREAPSRAGRSAGEPEQPRKAGQGVCSRPGQW